MHPILLRELQKHFRAKPDPASRLSSPGFFKVFDRLGPLRFGFSSVGPNGIRRRFRDFYAPEAFCEVYVCAEPSDTTITMEAINVYQACRPEIERLVQKVGGSVQDTGRHWIARVSIPLAECGAHEIRHCADSVGQPRKKVKSSHRIGALSKALHKLANALQATVDAMPKASQITTPPLIGDSVGVRTL
jgi:hypothetical protein